MDSLTHLVAGALTPLAFRGMPKRAAIIGFGIAAGELPDIDVFFGTGPEAMLTLHRGITHALAVQPLFVFLAVLPFYLWMRKRPLPAFPQAPSPGIAQLWLVALVASLVHIYLDCMTTFGTQILLPFSSARIGLPAMFIVDLLLTLPALAMLVAALRQAPETTAAGALAGGKSRRIARVALLWIMLYPLAALGINAATVAALGPALTAEAAAQSGMETAPPLPGENRLSLLTEPFAPVVWKAVVDQGRQYAMRPVCLVNSDNNAQDWLYLAKPEPLLYDELKQQHPLFGMFEAFSPDMVQMPLPADDTGPGDSGEQLFGYAFTDLRYVVHPASTAAAAGRGDGHFILQASVTEAGKLVALRFLERGNDAAHTPWIFLP